MATLRARGVGALIAAAGLAACDDLSSNLGQSDDDIISLDIPEQQPSPDLGVVMQLAVHSEAEAAVGLVVESGTADVGAGAGATQCFHVVAGESRVFAVTVKPTDGVALMRVSLRAPDGADCTGEERASKQFVIQRPATNPVDGGMP